MKRIFGAKTRLLVSVLALACILAVGGTMAYLITASDPVSNRFTAAHLDTGINDTGTGTDKTVSITNKGDSPAWVRARLLVSGIDPASVEIVNAAPQTPGAGKLYLVMPHTDSWSITPGGNTYNDLMNGDGWIYCTATLAPDSTSETLLEGVAFGGGVDPNAITITVTHESVLALGDSTDYQGAFANPAG